MDELGIKSHQGKKKLCSIHHIATTTSSISSKLFNDNFNHLCEQIDDNIKVSMNDVYKNSIDAILNHMSTKGNKNTTYVKTLFINANGLSLKFLINCIQDVYSRNNGLRRAAAPSIVLSVKLSHCNSLRNVIDMIKEKLELWHEKQLSLLVALDKPESFPINFINNFITIVAEKRFPITLAFFGHTSFTMMYQRINRFACKNLDVHYIEFPLAEFLLRSFLSNLLGRNRSEKNFFRVQLSGELVKNLCNSYLLENFSVQNMVKILRYSILEYCKTTSKPLSSLTSISDEWGKFDEKCEGYYAVLQILYQFVEKYDYKNSELSFWDLHVLVQMHKDKDFVSSQPYREWRSFWLTWDKNEWANRLKTLIDVCKNHQSLNERVEDLEDFLSDLEDLESRLSEMAIMSPEKQSTNNKTVQKTQRFAEWQKKKDVATSQRSNKTNLFYKKRDKIIHYLDKFFKEWLKPFQEFNHSYVVACPEDIDRIKLQITDEIEYGIAQPSGLLKNEQLDVCIVYRCLYALSEFSKTVSISSLFKDFRSRLTNSMSKQDDTNVESRFFNCLGQLELMGILRCSSSNASTVKLLYYPSHILIK